MPISELLDRCEAGMSDRAPVPDDAPRVRLVTWAKAAAPLTAIRTQVFVVEQAVPADEELDGLDPECVHALAEDASGRPIGTARLLPDGHIGRMTVLADARNSGVGAALMRLLLTAARERGLNEVSLHAQVRARSFYEAHGFVATSEDTYLSAGIPHVHMRTRL